MLKIDSLFNQEEKFKNAKDDKERNQAIKDLCQYKDKKGIQSEWAQKNKKIFEEVIGLLAQTRIFIVPNGTLESWAPDVEPKVRFAEIAPEVIKKNKALNQQFKNFMQRVLTSLGIEI